MADFARTLRRRMRVLTSPSIADDDAAWLMRIARDEPNIHIAPIEKKCGSVVSNKVAQGRGNERSNPRLVQTKHNVLGCGDAGQWLDDDVIRGWRLQEGLSRRIQARSRQPNQMGCVARRLSLRVSQNHSG